MAGRVRVVPSFAVVTLCAAALLFVALVSCRPTATIGEVPDAATLVVLQSDLPSDWSSLEDAATSHDSQVTCLQDKISAKDGDISDRAVSNLFQRADGTTVSSVALVAERSAVAEEASREFGDPETARCIEQTIQGAASMLVQVNCVAGGEWRLGDATVKSIGCRSESDLGSLFSEQVLVRKGRVLSIVVVASALVPSDRSLRDALVSAVVARIGNS